MSLQHPTLRFLGSLDCPTVDLRDAGARPVFTMRLLRGCILPGKLTKDVCWLRCVEVVILGFLNRALLSDLAVLSDYSRKL